MAPTPTPWMFVRGGTSTLSGQPFDYPATVRHVYTDEQGRRCTVFVASCEGANLPNDDNAQFIVRAVNCHADLLAALKRIMEYDDGPLHSGSKENYEWIGRSPKVWEAARAAIAKAEAK